MRKVHDTIVTACEPNPEPVAASRKRDLCADDIANLIQPVALELLGEPNRALSSKRELRYGNNGSLCVTIAGERVGQWYSFEDGQGGGVLDLIVRERGGTRALAMHWLKQQPYAAGRLTPRSPRVAHLDVQSRPARYQTPDNGKSRTEVPTSAGEKTPEGKSPDDPGPEPADAAIGAALSPSIDASQRPVSAGPPLWQQNKRLEPELDTRVEALELWRKAWPIEGTPAARYLRRRGIDPLKLMRFD